MTRTETILKIAALNDACRKGLLMPTFGKPKGRYILTVGISTLSPFDQIEIAAKVRNFDIFTEDNDPYGEHDFGAFDHKGQKVFWKIDYYDERLEWGSKNPADEEKTVRVLTVMLASEY